MKRVMLLVGIAVGIVVSWPVTALATFPGANGKIAFVDLTTAEDIEAMNPDGTGQVGLTNDVVSDIMPDWSPDGTKIAFARRVFSALDIYVMNADGTGLVNLTNTASLSEVSPTWSPDGMRIAFASGGSGSDLLVMNADGSNVSSITTGTDSEGEPDWSPDGSTILYTQNNCDIRRINPDGSGDLLVIAGGGCVRSPSWAPAGDRLSYMSFATGYSDVFVAAADGTNQVNLTDSVEISESEPDWSPDGELLAFTSNRNSGSQVWVMKADGTFPTRLTDVDYAADSPSWQRRPSSSGGGYARPKGAGPLRVPFVTAYDRCVTPSRQHGPSLSFGSCAPPRPLAGAATVGTPDANGKSAQSIGSFSATPITGDPSTPPNEADITLAFSVTDVRDRYSLDDYAGDLQVMMTLRLTDRFSGPGADETATIRDTPWTLDAICAPTSGDLGATCAITSSANAFVPGTVREGKRSIWNLGQVRVFDGGEDGLVASEADNTLFLKQGIFVP